MCIGVRDTGGLDKKNPFGFEYVRACGSSMPLREYEGRFTVLPLPNVSHVFYRRDVGYKAERIDLDDALEACQPPRCATGCSMHKCVRMCLLGRETVAKPSRLNHRQNSSEAERGE